MLWKPLRQLWTRARQVREKRPKHTAWNDIVVNSPDSPKSFSLNGLMSTIPAPPTDGNEMGRGQYRLGVIHNTADALGLDMGDYNHVDVEQDLNQPLPQIMDMDINPDGSDVMPPADPLVQNWLANENDMNPDLNLQTNNDFLRWSGWSPGLGDFALGADPMASFPIMNTNLGQGGAQQWY